LVEQLKIHLAPLARSRSLVFWDDTRISPGTDWIDEIKQALSNAAVAIIIVSPNYLASEFILNFELPNLLKASEEQGLRVVWLAASASLYRETPLAGFQALNDPSKPLDALTGSERNRVMVSVAEKIAVMAGQPY
jgi:TIR domain-containing protein